LQIAGYSTEILAKEFGVTNPNKKSKSTNGHSDAEPPCE
jgi:Fe-S cluster assembly iron-binding protein IscA